MSMAFSTFRFTKKAIAALSLVVLGVFSSDSYAQIVNDAGVVAMTAPLAPHTGAANTAIKIRVKNYGSNTITGVTIEWKIDGVAQTDFLYSAAILAGATTADITLNATVTDNPGKTFTFKTKMPNNTVDSDPTNDSFSAYSGAPISGTFIVGTQAGDHYSTLTQAVNALVYSGINGAVKFRVRPGSYSENMDIPAIPGSSATNTITFRSYSDKRDVTVISASNVEATLRLNGTDYITFKKMRFFNKNLTLGIGIHLLNKADFVTIDSCEIAVDSISNQNRFAGIAAVSALPTSAAVATTSNSTFTNNLIAGGYYGIVIISGTGANIDVNNIVQNNRIKETSYHGVYLKNNNNVTVKNNKVAMRVSADELSRGYHFEGLKSVDPTGRIEISSNYVTGAGTYGMWITSVEGTSTNRADISNNMVAGGFFSSTRGTNAATGIYVNTCGFMDINFNSVYMDAIVTDYTSKAFFLTGGAAAKPVRIQNNIFYNSKAGYAYYVGTAATVTVSDYNDYFSTPIPNSTTPPNFAFWGANQPDLTQLKAANSKDLFSLSVDPLFFEYYDLHTKNPLLNQKGVNIATIARDYDGEFRNTTAPDIGADEFEIGAADFAISAIAPSAFRLGVNNWGVVVRRLGDDPVIGNELYFEYSIDGVTQPNVYKYTFTQNIAKGETVVVTFPANMNITTTDYVPFNLCVNILQTAAAQNDVDLSNNTLCLDMCVGLDGTYTVPSTLFPTITDILDKMKCGLYGPTTIKLKSGIYNEQLYLWKVNNSSATNTLTIESETSNAIDTRLRFEGLTSENYATVIFNGAQYITLRNLTIENFGLQFAAGIQLAGNSKYNTITNCIINVDSMQNPTPATLVPIVASRLGTFGGLATANYRGINATENRVVNNKINGGYTGLGFYGFNDTQRDQGNVIQGNTISSFYRYGIYLDYSDTKIIANQIVGKVSMADVAVGISANNLGNQNKQDNLISRNRIYDISYRGIELVNARGSYKSDRPGATSTFEISNNFIGGGFSISSAGTNGIAMTNCNTLSILHNTIYMDAPRTTNASAATVPRAMVVNNSNDSIESYNNIFYSPTGCMAMEYYQKTGTTAGKTGLIQSNNNNFYTTGSKGTMNLIRRTTTSTTDYVLFTQYRAQNATRDVASKNVPIRFDMVPYDLHTNEPSLEDKGTAKGVLVDIDNEKRHATSPDIGADEFVNSGINLEVKEVVNPILCAAKPNVIKITLRNKGLYSLEGRKVRVYYTLTGGGQNFRSPDEEVVITKLKKIYDEQEYTFVQTLTVPKGMSYTLCARFIDADLPMDTVLQNNMACRDLCTGTEGVYTIGGTAGSDPTRHFNSIQDAVNSIECGICDETLFNVRPGTYTERITIPKFLVNIDKPRLTIQAENGPNTVLIEPLLTSTNPAWAANRSTQVVRLLGAQYVTLKDLNISNIRTDYGVGIQFTRDAQFNLIEGCQVTVNSTLTTKKFYPILYSSILGADLTDENARGRNGNNNRILRSKLIGGYTSVGLLGKDEGNPDYENSIDSTEMKDFYEYGVFGRFSNINSISNNTITPRSAASPGSSAIYLMNGSDGGRINANIIKGVKFSGVTLSNIDASASRMMLVSNNWVTAGFGPSTNVNAGGIVLKFSGYVGLYYNSIYYDGKASALNLYSDSIVTVPNPGGEPSKEIYQNHDVKMYNNIISKWGTAADNSYAYYVGTTNPFIESDNNDIYANFLKFSYYNPYPYDDLSLLIRNSGREFSSLSIDPQFVSSTDLNIATDTLKFDYRGRPVAGINRDFYNRKRSPRIPDIGSIEYVKDSINLSIFNAGPDKGVKGTNIVSATMLNESYSNMTGKQVTLQYSTDNFVSHIVTQTFTFSNLPGRYDEEILKFSTPIIKTDYTPINLCVRIKPDQRIAGDTITAYESFCKTICIGVDKNLYTIGKSNADFLTFTDAINSLVCGFDSSITFVVKKGVYNERFMIPTLRTNADTTITFVSETNNPDDVIIRGTGSGNDADHAVIKLANANYITFKGITVENTSLARGSCIQIADRASYNKFLNCKFLLDSNSTTNSLVGIVSSSSNGIAEPVGVFTNNNVIRNCYFKGGAYGIRLLGDSTPQANTLYNQIVDNVFEKNNITAIDVFYSKVDSIKGNVITMRNTNAKNIGIKIYGVSSQDPAFPSDLVILANNIKDCGNAGIVIEKSRATIRSIIANNMIAGRYRPDALEKGNYGLALINSGTIDVVYNSVLYDGQLDSSAAFTIQNCEGLYIFNNIFANYGKGFALDYNSSLPVVEADDNVLYTNGAYLANWNHQKADVLSKLGLLSGTIFNMNTAASFDPRFKSNHDLHVNHSELNGKGKKIAAITVDIDGDLRVGPDIGADEFNLQEDASILSFITPTDQSYIQGTNLVAVNISNESFEQIGGFKVKYKVDGVLVDSADITSINPHAVLPFSFLKYYSTRQAGPHEICAYTDARRDFNRFNDTLCITVYSLDSADIGVAQIVSPVNNSNLDSLTPVTVRISNYGNLKVQNYKVALSINNEVKRIETITDTIYKKTTHDHTFNYKINPDSAIFFDICAYTILGEDMIGNNDSICTVVGTVGLKNTRSGQTITAYPNPTTGEFKFAMYLDRPQELNLVVYDMLGKVVYRKDYGFVDAGEHILSSDLQELKDGTYFFVMTSGDNKYNGRVVVIR